MSDPPQNDPPQSDPFAEALDATRLTAEERIGLIPTWIATRADLNGAELSNIAAGQRWALRTAPDVLEARVLMALHRRMFGDVWRWAGRARRSEKNIGVADWWRIEEHLRALLEDVRAQIAGGRAGDARGADETAVDFHHRLVAIHLFANGNGRHARLAADLLAGRLGRPAFTWGRAGLGDVGAARSAYIAALKAADGHDPGPLVAFARS